MKYIPDNDQKIFGVKTMKKKRMTKLLSVLFVFCLIFSLLSGGEAAFSVKAAGTSGLMDKAESVKLESIINKSNGSEIVYPWDESSVPDVTYEDTLLVKLSWVFANNTILDTQDVLTYDLPENVNFNDVEDTPIYDGNKIVGKFSIKNNKISIQYTDEKFCRQNNRTGSLSFSGNISRGAGGGTQEQDVVIEFPGLVDVKVHMKPSPIVSNFRITKKTFDNNPEDTDIPSDITGDDLRHVYRVKIYVESIGNNTNVEFRDLMWPGMTLVTAPEFYADEDLSEPYEGASAFKNMNYEIGGNKINFDIPSMGNTDSFYVTYLILINNNMYSMDTANEFLMDNDPEEFYTGREYIGRVPNRASLWSDETKAQGIEENDIRAWGEVGTITGAIDKWGNTDKHRFDEGIMNWEIVLKSIINNPDIREGYIVDILPAHLSLVKDSVIVRDVDSYHEIPDGVSINTESIEDGKTKVTFTFSDELISELKNSPHSKFISYDTKIEEQTEDEVDYTNKASIYYDGDKIIDISATDTFKKPKDLSKTSVYDELTAPNAVYVLTVNPAGLDLDPDTDELFLDDIMSSAFDLVIDSVRINGAAPTEDQFSYDTETRKMTFKLSDGAAYVIKYDARVMLAGDDSGDTKELTEENSKNIVNLYAINPGKYKASDYDTINSSVFQSAGSSSSEDNPGSLTVYKVRKDDSTKRLEGATFTLTKMNGTEELTASSEKTTKTTDINGQVDFIDMTRGVIFMLTEDSAPQNFVKDDTPRFYAFEDPKVTLGDTVTYEGVSYTLTQFDEALDHNTVTLKNALEDKNIKISKINDKGEAISGVGLRLSDDNKAIETWITGNTPKVIEVAPGNYTLEEITTPEEYESLSGSIQFTVNEDNTINLSDSGAAATNATVDSTDQLLIKVKNDKREVLGSLRFSKTFNGLDSDANADSIIFNVYEVDLNDNISDSPIKGGTFTWGDIKADGYKQFDNLKPGKYRVIESSTDINGYDFKNNDTEKQVDIEVKASNNAQNPATGTITNKYSRKTRDVLVDKRDIAGGDELEGAVITIYSGDVSRIENPDDDQKIESWTSSEEAPHRIEGLEYGKTYTLRENTAPAGYDVTADTVFRITMEGTIEILGTGTVDNTTGEEIIVINDRLLNQIVIKKMSYINEECSQSEDDEYRYQLKTLAGATYGLFEADDTKFERPVKTTTSDDNGIISFKDITLKEHEYIVKEIEAPEGYILSDELIYVTINEEGNVSITDKNGKAVSEVLNELYRTDIVLTKVSEQNPDKKLPDAEYVLYRKTNDGEVEIAREKTNEDGQIVFNGVIANNVYIIKEVASSAGCYISEKPIVIEITVKEAADGKKKASVASIDMGEGEDGAETAYIDEETGELVWLEPEIRVSVLKVDEDNNTLPEAVLEIREGSPKGRMIDSWMTTLDYHFVDPTLLKSGETYYVVEAEAPKGYEIAEPISFKLADTMAAGENEPIIIKMTDVKEEEKSTEDSTDETTEQTTDETTEQTTDKATDETDEELGSIIITVTEDGTDRLVPGAVVDVEFPDGTTVTYTTDEKGQIVLTDVLLGGYTITIRKVPDGYNVTTDKILTCTVTGGSTSEREFKVVTTNTTETAVKTSDETPVAGMMVIVFISLAGMVFFVERKNKNNKE